MHVSDIDYVAAARSIYEDLAFLKILSMCISLQ